MTHALLPRHSRYEHSSISKRPDYAWPDGRRLAVCITTNIEVFAFGAGQGVDPARQEPIQNQRNYAWRDYGNRIGIWRFFELAEQLRIPLAHNVNSLVYDYAPDVMDAIRKRGDERIGHGRSNAETARGMWEADEAHVIEEVNATFRRHEGHAPAGWMGAGGMESPHTLDLLKEAGYRYVMDWPLDDQPVWLRTRAGPILSVPYPMELNDLGTIVMRHESAAVFADMIVDQFDEMLRQSSTQPLVMNVSIHPYVLGQPFRLNRLRRALAHCIANGREDRVWWTRPGAIADYCHTLAPGIVPGSA